MFLCLMMLSRLQPLYYCIDAARRFFQTKVEEDYLKKKGKYSDKVKRQHKRNRINRVRVCIYTGVDASNLVFKSLAHLIIIRAKLCCSTVLSQPENFKCVV